jgi:hypothetical protein
VDQPSIARTSHTPDGTQVKLRLSSPPLATIAFGEPSAVQQSRSGLLVATFSPGTLVAYLVRSARHRALYLFRTTETAQGTELFGVSCPVDLLFVTTTTRSLRRVKASLRYLRRHLGAAATNALSDWFWLRLGDFVERRKVPILPLVRDTLRCEKSRGR